MTAKRCYVYGFANLKEAHRIGSIGLDNQDVYLRSGDRISVVMSDVDGIDFSQLPQKSLFKYLAQHQRVLERLMDWGDVIPLKFGTLVENLEEVDTILAKGQARIQEAFAKVEGKRELDVVAGFSDFEGVLREIGTSETIMNFQRAPRPDSEVAFHNARIALGKMVKSALDEKRLEYADVILKRLSGVSVDSRVLDIRDDAMITNVASLLDQKDLSRFEGEIDALDRVFEDRVNFRMVGPLPCNSFYTFMIKNVNFEEINSARKCLELPEKTTLSDIKSAYKLMTRNYHPDSGPKGMGDAHRFESINKSYRMLMDACPRGILSFLEKDVRSWVEVRPMKGDVRGVL